MKQTNTTETTVYQSYSNPTTYVQNQPTTYVQNQPTTTYVNSQPTNYQYEYQQPVETYVQSKPTTTYVNHSYSNNHIEDDPSLPYTVHFETDENGRQVEVRKYKPGRQPDNLGDVHEVKNKTYTHTTTHVQSNPQTTFVHSNPQTTYVQSTPHTTYVQSTPQTTYTT